MNKSFLLSFILWLPMIISATPVQYISTPKGIIVSINQKQVELAVANTTAFRLSVCTSGNPETNPSIFMSDGNNAIAAYTIVAEDHSYGIKTSYGKLMINLETKMWSLYDSNGKVLIPNGGLNSTDTVQTIDELEKEAGSFYGSGNKSSKDLTKTLSKSSSGNGNADVPYFWSTVGYCALGITENDDKPAQWDSNGNTGAIWSFPGSSADLYLWPAKTLYEATSGLAKLTGQSKLPPKWAFGFMQSRWGWVDRADIEDAVNKFRSHKLPVDALIYDFEWYTVTPDYNINKNGEADFCDFGFNPKLFPEPAKQISDYKSKGFKFIGIRKPRLGNSGNLNLARSKGWLKDPESNSRDLNFSNDSLAQWYKTRNRPLLDAGVDAWWNDEGESYYSCYYWWNKAQFDLLATVKPNERHFSINRSFSLGNQRLGYCTWSGDIQSTWNSLAETPSDLLNWSLAGMCYSSCDIGGFNGTPSKENMVRWFQAGVFFPIMRAHGNCVDKPRLPWLWDTDGEDAIRKALNLRYQLIPYIYSLGHEAYNTGAPIMRPLLMEFQNDTNVMNLKDEWLLGKGLLAAPVMNADGSRDIYLPKDLWYDFNNSTGLPVQGPVTFSVAKNLDEIPVYVRAGTILPIGPVIQYTSQVTITPLEIRIYPGKDGLFTLTEDDGSTYDYMKGKVRETTYVWTDATRTLSWKVKGLYSGKEIFKTIKVVIGKEIKKATLGLEGNIIF